MICDADECRFLHVVRVCHLIIQEKHKQELEALKSAHASALTSQAANCEVHRLQLDNDRINIEQLKKALDLYQQKEVS